MTKKEFLDYTGFCIFWDNLKNYIESQGVGVTTEDVQKMIDASNNGLKLSDDNTYLPLDEL